METTAYRSRWDPRKTRDIIFVESDVELCKFLAPEHIRDPWSYQYSTVSYMTAFLGRGLHGLRTRLPDLASNGYLAQPEQSTINAREIIYCIGKKGIDELKGDGFAIKKPAPRPMPHELLSCITAASMEFGAAKRSFPILSVPMKLDFRPDWPVFRLLDYTIFLEADMMSESEQTIEDKFLAYLALFDTTVEDGLALFVTLGSVRIQFMIERLKGAIDRNGYRHALAKQFIFININEGIEDRRKRYNRFVNAIPPLTDWALTRDYQRAGKIGPFNFLKN